MSSYDERGGWLHIEWKVWRPRRVFWKLIGTGIVIGGYLVWKYLIF